MRSALSVLAASLCGAKGAFAEFEISGATAFTSFATTVHSSGDRPVSCVCMSDKSRARVNRCHQSWEPLPPESKPPAIWLRRTKAYLSSSTSRRSQFCSASTLGATRRRSSVSATSCSKGSEAPAFSLSNVSTVPPRLGSSFAICLAESSRPVALKKSFSSTWKMCISFTKPSEYPPSRSMRSTSLSNFTRSPGSAQRCSLF
mmetsp:Transcript_31045/g.78559  ORF Transcript_31045/g.78559 Transcript_31045/m.78559 type:complete len:202 (-) Transcript_31045:429-1034(-)